MNLSYNMSTNPKNLVATSDAQVFHPKQLSVPGGRGWGSFYNCWTIRERAGDSWDEVENTDQTAWRLNRGDLGQGGLVRPDILATIVTLK